MKNKPLKGLFMFQNQWDELEKLFSLPVDERQAYLSKLHKQKKTEFLGVTDKTAPELSVEFIKKGVRAKSYVAPPESDSK